MFGPGAKFPPLAPLAPLAPRALAPLVPLAPAYAALPVLATPGAWQAKSHGPPVKMPAAAAKPQDVLLMIRQGVASQDRGAVKNALQLAHQLGTPIEPPILEMLRKWLGEEAFNAATGKAPGLAPMAPIAPAPLAPAPLAPLAEREPERPNQPPLVVIREGVAEQNREKVRNALRLAVEQGTQIDAPVLEMLRKWLGQDDEALNTLAARKGVQLNATEQALAASTVKASPTLPPSASSPVPGPAAPAVPTAPPAAPQALEPTEPIAAAKAAPGPVPPGPVEHETAKSAPQPAPPKSAPKAAPMPVIRRGPVLNTEKSPAPPPPDLDASFDAFMQELSAPEASASPEPEAKRRKKEEDAESPAQEPPREEVKRPPPKPKPEPPRPKVAPKPKPPAKDEWGRESAPESTEKEAWQYLQEAKEAAKTSVWGAGNFIDFNNFK
ncbi:unnamed protein product [Effrenium voratum]|nr:unnamed protein product [Effrenium voratum]